MCDDTRCLSWLDGEFLYRDASHGRNLPEEVKQRLATIMGLDAVFAPDPRAQTPRVSVRGSATHDPLSLRSCRRKSPSAGRDAARIAQWCRTYSRHQISPNSATDVVAKLRTEVAHVEARISRKASIVGRGFGVEGFFGFGVMVARSRASKPDPSLGSRPTAHFERYIRTPNSTVSVRVKNSRCRSEIHPSLKSSSASSVRI